MRVLIIDDDEDVVFSLQTILCAKGVEVVGTGTDGSEAVKLYEELQPDILLMDIQMKPMNGLDAAEQILAKDKTARVLFLDQHFPMMNILWRRYESVRKAIA